MKKSAPNSRNKILPGLLLQLGIGVFLASVTYMTLRTVKSTAESVEFGWLTITPAGPSASLGLTMLLLIVLIADALWLIYFILWIIRKKLHLDNSKSDLGF